jgi:hypothetical protein
MLQKLRQAYENFEQTLTEGNYRSGPRSVWARVFGTNEELPETTEIAVGATMLGTSRTWGTRLVWAGAVAWLSVHFLAWAAVGVGLLGAGVLANEYVHCRRARNDVITEVNFAGQKVEGKRSDLCRLHMAQVRIMNLANAFRPASAETTHETVQQIMDSVKAESRRVKVIDAGRYDADKNAYDFSEPGIKLVNDRNNPDHDARAKVAAVPSLKEAWESRRLTEDEVVDHLAALERALPPTLQEKLAKKRAAPQA